jgi:arylsulfatase A-like enzyme
MDPQAVTFANLLKAAGYATCLAGKRQLGRSFGAVAKRGMHND